MELSADARTLARRIRRGLRSLTAGLPALAVRQQITLSQATHPSSDDTLARLVSACVLEIDFRKKKRDASFYARPGLHPGSRCLASWSVGRATDVLAGHWSQSEGLRL